MPIMNSFIRQECIKLNKSDCKDMLIKFYLKNAVTLYSSKKKSIPVSRNIKQHNCFQHW